MASNRYCDGVQRRDFLKAGFLGGLGLTLADYLQLEARGETQGAKATSAIFINLGGGPSHMDTFDLKPKAGAEFRGEFNPIQTQTPGIEFSQHLPKLAQLTSHFAILRGVSHTLAAHELGTKYMITGNRPIPSVEYPGYGSVVAKELPSPEDLPKFVAIPSTPQVAGYLGIEYAAMSTGGVPKPGQKFNVRGVTLSGGLTVDKIERREKLLGDLDTAFKGYEEQSSLLKGLDQFGDQAQRIITSSRTRNAFDVSQENKEIAGQFGETGFGMSCLLATRLVEAGVRFVTVTLGGWDTHNNNFQTLKDKKLPEFDQGLSALFATLATKGLLEKTAVCVTGEFGRTPKINPRAGRDHWPRAMFVLMAGGGVRGGQVIGASDDNGMGPQGTPITPEEVGASFYRNLGIDFTKEYHSATGRPLMIVRNGKAIDQLFA
jgi:hypothetical protein